MARNAATSSPREVSIATGVDPSSVSPASASIAVSSANPAAESAIRRLATNCPSAFTNAMS